MIFTKSRNAKPIEPFSLELEFCVKNLRGVWMKNFTVMKYFVKKTQNKFNNRNAKKKLANLMKFLQVSRPLDKRRRNRFCLCLSKGLYHGLPPLPIPPETMTLTIDLKFAFSSLTRIFFFLVASTPLQICRGLTICTMVCLFQGK